MPAHAIRVFRLSKRYQIGAPHQRAETFREAIMQAATCRWRRAGQDAESDPTTLWALGDVSFDVARGDRLGIIGGNGSGKSTLLRILSRITDPTTGRAEIRGRVGSLLEVGTGFHPDLSGRENIYLNGALLGMKKSQIDRRFDEIVAFAEVERFLDTAVKKYSSGMYMRLAFAVAAHLESEVLLMDEVLAVGDAEFQKKCLSRMDEAAEQGRTILFVSHNMAAVRKLCNKVLLLEQGRVRMFGDPDETLAAYLPPTTASAENGRAPATPASHRVSDRVALVG
jgi:lipopolysaccharide transport system ATP-binding protein